MSEKPLPTELNGRDGKGRFGRGNRFASGNPLNKRVQQLRNALLSTVKQKDVKEIARALLEKAKRGDVAAARELLDRLLGKPAQAIALTDGDGSPLQLQALTAVMMEALAPFPQARQAVAAKLLELDQ